MTNFCTLFDHNYLSRALVLYESITKHCSDNFTLYVLATDREAYDWLLAQHYKNITVQSLGDIQSAYPVLERLRTERTRAEFSWTLSSFSIQFFLKKYDLPSITYLDADICFYADPRILFDELDGESVIITPHNYTPCYDQTATSGRYCVQFMYFKNDAAGNEVLEWWRNECEKCCCGTPTDGKFGDQKYLDDWLSRFAGKVHEERHRGCGIAPWNVQQFDIVQKDNGLYVQDKVTKVTDRLVFFHFHGLKEYTTKDLHFVWNMNGSYEYAPWVSTVLYKPYIKRLEALCADVPQRKYALYKEQPLSFLSLIARSLWINAKLFIKSFLLHRTFRKLKEEALKQKSCIFTLDLCT